MVSFPCCKINLGLNVIKKRTDGYHDLVTCFYPVPWTDILEIIPSSKTVFTSTGFSIPGRKEDNLCLKAYDLLKTDFSLSPVSIHLHKVVPMGAGLGGGSSNGAYTLRLLNQVFDLDIGQSQLVKYASRLGSDCAFFIQDSPQLATGRGEVLEPVQVNLKGKSLLIVKPDIHISTADAFQGIVPKHPETDIRTVVEDRPVAEWKNLLKNDFEETIGKKFPEIAAIKRKLYEHGALYTSMTGSGSCVYGIFEKETTIDFSPWVQWSCLL